MTSSEYFPNSVLFSGALWNKIGFRSNPAPWVEKEKKNWAGFIKHFPPTLIGGQHIVQVKKEGMAD